MRFQNQMRQVVESVHNADSTLCVDIFIRPDGSFGYEEYRRDFEDGGGWFSLARHSGKIFDTADKALSDAVKVVKWLL